jgi:hypothetical protein
MRLEVPSVVLRVFLPVFLPVLALAIFPLGCGSSSPALQLRPEVQALASTITTVVALSPELDFGGATDQQRTLRRLGDAVLSATGGRAIIAEELKGASGPALTAVVRSLGEDPARALTFFVTASRSNRADFTAPPLAGAPRGPVRVVLDYRVQLEVRRVGNEEVIGTIHTTAGTVIGDREVTLTGENLGLPKAVEEAVQKAVQTYAPSLVSRAVLPRLIEVPDPAQGTPSGTPVTVDRLRRVQLVYPERPAMELVTLAATQARFLIIAPGTLAAFGIAAGDLLGGSGARPLTSRGELFRTLARGAPPAVYVERQGERFLIGQTVIATSGR